MGDSTMNHEPPDIGQMGLNEVDRQEGAAITGGLALIIVICRIATDSGLASSPLHGEAN
jgi:hypothetical protein